jgi:arabinofuranosyltransferase
VLVWARGVTASAPNRAASRDRFRAEASEPAYAILRPMPGRRFLIALGGVFFLVVLIRTAWLSELSYLTLRTIEHAATGHGLRWNVSERVQVFDHPLWMLMLLAGRIATGESYYTTFVISLALSAATAVVVLRSATRGGGIVLGTVMLSLSWALVTYSTSGLEGPLAHLLVASFCVMWLHATPGARDGKTLAGLAGLAALTHPATLLITGPALMAMMRRGARPPRHSRGRSEVESDTVAAHERIRAENTTVGRNAADADQISSADRSVQVIVFWAAAPPLAWALFATFYYGTPVPMPVIAEWTEHAGAAPRLHAAVRMLAFAMRHDPLTVAVISTALVLGLRAARASRSLAWGVMAYGVVLALWAGDAMPGRWLSLPCLVSILIVLGDPVVDRPRVVPTWMAIAVALAAVPSLAPIQSDVRFGTAAQITDRRDQRVADYRATGLLLDIRQWYPPQHPEATRGGIAWQDTNRVRTSPHPGFFGFAAGYGVHVIDRTGRTDPLLARLPPAGTAAFPAGLQRQMPEGYEASLPDRDNAIRDPALAAYYDRVRFVTRGRLANPRRLLAALRLAIGDPPGLKSRLDDDRILLDEAQFRLHDGQTGLHDGQSRLRDSRGWLHGRP